MPMFTTDKQGRMGIQLKAMTLAEEDFQLYGPIGRDDESLAARARFHITQMEQSLPTPETILAIPHWQPSSQKGKRFRSLGVWN